MRGERSHKAASGGKSSNVVARLVIWVMVDRIAAETKNSNGAVGLCNIPDIKLLIKIIRSLKCDLE